jgi:mono/diheme cytochrome c family protein
MRTVTRRLKLFVLLLSAGCVLAAAMFTLRPVAAQSNDPNEFFEKRIRPLLAANCFKCHNPQAQVAKLDLTTAAGFAKGGESGPLLDRDNPEKSRLLKVVSYAESLKMPPTGKLNDDDIAALATWVAAGAPWPNADSVATVKPKSSTREFTAEERAFWAFQPLAVSAVPAVKNKAWVKSPIDAFVLAKLEAKGLKPAPPADKLTLLRRASYDLTGLPPNEKEMNEFLADTSPDAFAKVVERLLASPRYGEKWGRHWLDVARYADSTGNDEDHRYPHAWKYRDYVIKAFNDDLPYDQFVREQIAGDLLPAPNGDEAGSEVNKRGIIATGFLALGAKAIAQQDKMKMRYDVWDEQVDVTTKAFLGMTVACARCHNHKFDPILTKDYYSLIGMFASTRSFTNPDSHVSVVLEKPLVPSAEWQQYQAAKKAHGEKQKRVRLALDVISDEVGEALVREHSRRLAAYMMAARRVYQDGEKAEGVALEARLKLELLQKWVNLLKPDPEQVRGYLNEWHAAPPGKLADVAQSYQTRFQKRWEEWQATIATWRQKYQEALSANKQLPDKPKFEEGDDRFFNDVCFGDGPFGISDKDKDCFSAAQWATIEALHKEQEALKNSAPPEPELACAIEEEEKPATQHVLTRGDYNNKGEEAPRAFPAILARYDTKPQFTGSGRLQFADWLTRPENPLPARVLVNRVWQWHFGEGLVRTPDNFGKMGERPTHPELLDYLAAQFIKRGFSIKSLHRLLMLSSTYQMASENPAAMEADGDNRLLSRFNRRRLAIEELRDGLLALDGTLDLTMGGSLQTGRGTDGETSQGRLSIDPEKQKRRTVYLPLRRANLPTLLNLFDFGDATTVNGKRQLTNVATQALFWLNSEFLTDRSTELAKLLLADTSKDDAVRLTSAYRRILNRPASKDELAAGLKYIKGFEQKFSGEKAAQKAWQSFCRALMASNEFIYLD